MQHTAKDGAPAPTWSLDGFRAGMVVMLPSLPGAIVFAAAFGALAAQKDLSLFETVLMSGLVFAGVSQFVSMELWSTSMSAGVILAILLSTLIVNLRMVLMGAALQPWIATAPPRQIYPGLLLMTDGNWLAAMRYRREGGSDIAYLVGGGAIVWLVWVPATALGQVFGSLLQNPRAFGIDLILPLYFVALLAPMFESTRRAIPWAVAGVTAAAVYFLVPGFWYVMAGAVAGAIAGGLLGDD